MKTCDIACIMPAYNPDPALLKESVSALLAQTHPCDIIIVDDGSRVPVVTLLPPHDRIKVIRLDRNVGVTRARNEGLRQILEAGYEFIACNDYDDVSMPDRMALQMNRFQQEQKLDVVGGMSPTYDDKGRFLFVRGTEGGPEAIRQRVRHNLPFAHSTFLFRADVVRRFGNYSVEFPAGEDYEFLYRIIARGGHVDCIAQNAATYLLNPGGITYKNWQRQVRTRLKTQLRYFDPWVFGSYSGVARTIITLMVPHRIWVPLKGIVRKAMGDAPL